MAEENTYFEFGDVDDPMSRSHPDYSQTGFRIGIEPEMFLMALIDEPKALHPDVLPAVRRIMEAAYWQGRRVGALAGRGE